MQKKTSSRKPRHTFIVAIHPLTRLMWRFYYHLFALSVRLWHCQMRHSGVFQSKSSTVLWSNTSRGADRLLFQTGVTVWICFKPQKCLTKPWILHVVSRQQIIADCVRTVNSAVTVCQIKIMKILHPPSEIDCVVTRRNGCESVVCSVSCLHGWSLQFIYKTITSCLAEIKTSFGCRD